MEDPGPLQGKDITAHLRQAQSFGVSPGQAADGVPTVEFTTDPAVHGPHGYIGVQHSGTTNRRLSALVEVPSRGRAACASDDSIRVWGRFAPSASVVVASAGPVRIVARTPAGALLAGPITVSPDGPPAELTW